MMKRVAETDQKASEFLKKSPEKIAPLTTDFSVNSANELFNKWKKLDEYLLVKYMDGNTKKQNPDGSFKNNGHSDKIPPAPDFPGYTDIWKKAVKESAGLRLREP